MTETHEHQASSPEQLLSPEESFLEMVRKMNETAGSKLYDLFKKEGNSEKFEELLDDFVYEIALSDPTYDQNAELLKSGRLKDQDAAAVAKTQREIIEVIRKLVIAEAGLPTSELQTAIEKGQEAVREKLEGIDLSTTSTDEILRKLSILEEDKDGGAHFNYPVSLFPEEITEKWNLYIDAVKTHIDVSRKVHAGFIPRQDLEVADGARRLAHNRISEDMHQILGFDKLPESDWDFEKTRNLVAKMRERKFIDKPTSESVLTSQALARGIGISVLTKLAERTAKR